MLLAAGMEGGGGGERRGVTVTAFVIGVVVLAGGIPSSLHHYLDCT